MNRPLIFIADLLHALDDLRIESPSYAREVMRMLSLESWTEIATPRSGTETARASIPAVLAPVEPLAPATAGSSPAARSEAAQGAPVEPTRAMVTTLEPAPSLSSRPAWAAAGVAMPRAVASTSPPPDPLLDPKQDRAIVGSLAAGLVDDESVDVESLIAALARGEPLRTLPIRRAWGLRGGLQVLIDHGAGMAPFSADVDQLFAQLLRLLPRDRVQRAGFEGSPLRALRIPRRKRAPWQPPAADTAVLVISDLGLCTGDERLHSAGVAEWLEVAELARRARVQLRTLVPYPPSRWPAALSGPLRCIHWDRRTTAATTRRTLAGMGR